MPLSLPRTLRLKFALYLGSVLSAALGCLLFWFWAYRKAKHNIIDQVDPLHLAGQDVP